MSETRLKKSLSERRGGSRRDKSTRAIARRGRRATRRGVVAVDHAARRAQTHNTHLAEEHEEGEGPVDDAHDDAVGLRRHDGGDEIFRGRIPEPVRVVPNLIHRARVDDRAYAEQEPEDEVDDPRDP